MGQLQKFLRMNECRLSFFYMLNNLGIVNQDHIRKLIIEDDTMRRILDSNDFNYRGDNGNA